MSKKFVFIILTIYIVMFAIFCDSKFQEIIEKDRDRESIFKITDKKYSFTRFTDYPSDDSENDDVTYKYALWDEKKHTGVIDEIQKYKVNKEKYVIYIIGKDSWSDDYLQYFIFNYKNNNLQSYTNLQDMSDEDKIIFEEDNDWLTPTRYSY